MFSAESLCSPAKSPGIPWLRRVRVASRHSRRASDVLVIVQQRCLSNEAAIRCILVAMMSSSLA